MGGRTVGGAGGSMEAVGAGTRTSTTIATITTTRAATTANRANRGRGNKKNKATSVKQKENNKAKLPHRMRLNGSYFGRLNVRISIYIIYACCYLLLLLIMAAAASNNVVNGLKCYCNPKECDVIRALDCPGKGLMLWDPCQ